MGFEEFEDLAAREVTVEAFRSETAYGVASYDDPVAARARVQLGPVRIVNAQGEEVVAHVRVYLGRAVAPKDRLTLPDGRAPRILRVEARDDEAGPHHWVIYC